MKKSISARADDPVLASLVTPIFSPLPLPFLLLFAPFQPLLTGQATEVKNQPDGKSGQAIDENIGKRNNHRLASQFAAVLANGRRLALPEGTSPWSQAGTISGSGTSPLAMAKRVRRAILWILSLRIRRSRWVSTVRVPMLRRHPISLLHRPSAI